MQQEPTMPAPPGVEYCYRHPGEETRVHCTRCGKPICPQCMIPAPVGHQCPDCVAEARREFQAGPGKRIMRANLTFTNSMIGLLIAIFVVEVAQAGPDSLFNGPTSVKLIELGGGSPLHIAFLSQYWRLVTEMFLHIGILHLALNCYSLWLLGTHAERDFGRTRILVIYFVAGLGGSVAAYAMELGPTAGASGAIFGLVGAFLAFNYARRNTALGRMRVRWVWQILILNAFIAFGIRSISWQAHLGGLVTGLVCGWLLDDRRQTISRGTRIMGILAVLVFIAGVAAWRTADLRSTYPADQVRQVLSSL